MNSQQTPAEIACWIALSEVEGLGNASLCALLKRFGSPEAVIHASIQSLLEVVSKPVANLIPDAIQAAKPLISQTLTWLENEANHFVSIADANYPELLLEINNPPAFFYAKGNLACLQRTCLAIVGSRNATVQGEKNAENFAQALSQQGVCVVSGMALGIDGAAHRGALKGVGGTVAVVGTGLDTVYPAKHRDLAHQIAREGLLISEFSLGTPSKAQNFPRRNRLISGLSQGCLVVEASPESGSLITARLASEQGRDVFAIPGSIHSPTAKGCHDLIKQGAKLVDHVQDILEELQIAHAWHLNTAENSPLNGFETAKNDSPDGLIPQWANDQEKQDKSLNLINIIGFEGRHFDDLQAESGLTTEALSAMLSLLELEGKIAKNKNGQYQQLQ